MNAGECHDAKVKNRHGRIPDAFADHLRQPADHATGIVIQTDQILGTAPYLIKDKDAKDPENIRG